MNLLTPVLYLAKKNPAATLSVLTLAAGGVTALIGHPEFSPVLVTVAAAFLGLHTKVVTKDEANKSVVAAATDAATTTAANLTATTVGVVGEVTEAASSVVNDAVGLVTGLMK